MVNHYAREVQIDITSRHQRVSLRTRVFAHDRLERLSRFNSWVSRIQLVLGEEHHEFLAEAIVHVDSRDPIVVSEVSGGYRSALDGLLVKLERLLTKDKELRRDHRNRPSCDLIPPGPHFGEEPTYQEILQGKMTA
jgi:ribosomal subunit interface protein